MVISEGTRKRVLSATSVADCRACGFSAASATGSLGDKVPYWIRADVRRGHHRWRSTQGARQWRTKHSVSGFRVQECKVTLQAYSFVRQSSHAHREARGPVESNHAEPHTSGDPLVLMKHLWPRRGRARGGAAPGPDTGPEGGQLRPSPSWTSWGAAPSGCWGAHRRRRW
jgi:hypothetical protein